MLRSIEFGGICKDSDPPICEVILHYNTKTETKMMNGYAIRDLYKKLNKPMDNHKLLNYPNDEKLRSFIIFPDRSNKIDTGFIKDLWDLGLVFKHMKYNQLRGTICIVALGTGQTDAVKYINQYGDKNRICFLFIEDTKDENLQYPNCDATKFSEGMYVNIGDDYSNFDRPEIVKEIYYLLSNTNGNKLSWFQTSSALNNDSNNNLNNNSNNELSNKFNNELNKSKQRYERLYLKNKLKYFELKGFYYEYF